MRQFFSSLYSRIPRLEELRVTRRWLLVVVFVVLFLGFCYAIYRATPYLEGFQQYGYIGAFLVSFIASATVVFPMPGIVVVLAIAASPVFNTALVALAAGVGAALGETTAYFAGYAGRAVVGGEGSERYQRVENWVIHYGGWAVWFLAFVPLIPFDVVGITAGVLKYPVQKFVLFSLLGKVPRSFIECYAGAGLINLIFPFLFD